jgi:predicted SnoaL-like aldol condensation-catalyzing enzyme
MDNNGGRRPGSGRKSKAEEQLLAESLTPMKEDALKALHEGVKKGNAIFVKMFMEYFYGKPKETVKMTHEIEKGQRFKIGDTLIEF